MDFGHPHSRTNNILTRSGLRIFQSVEDAASTFEKKWTSEKDKGEEVKIKCFDPSDKIDQMLIKTSNQAVVDLFLGNQINQRDDIKNKHNVEDGEKIEAAAPPGTDGVDSHLLPLVDCSLYPDRCLTNQEQQQFQSNKTVTTNNLILPNALVVIFESFDSLTFTYASPHSIFTNRNGQFHHDDFLYRPYGIKIRSRPASSSSGTVTLLRPTPQLWSRTLNHRTQIVQDLDASMIVHMLDIVPNDVVCESGTGSGAMSHYLMRAVAPHGRLHTYEFHEDRVRRAREEFGKNGLGHLVCVHWRDVCSIDHIHCENDEKKNEKQQEKTMGQGKGFNLSPNSVDAIFLDLPEPWLAIPAASHVLKPNHRLASYSPCMEQVQRTVKAMTTMTNDDKHQCKFHSVVTLEVRLKEYYVDRVELDGPPEESLPPYRVPPDPKSVLPGAIPPEKLMKKKDKGFVENSNDDKNGKNKKRKSLLCARPFATMRGHTAFLTFGTATLKQQSKEKVCQSPNDKQPKPPLK